MLTSDFHPIRELTHRTIFRKWDVGTGVVIHCGKNKNICCTMRTYGRDEGSDVMIPKSPTVQTELFPHRDDRASLFHTQVGYVDVYQNSA